MKRLLTVALTVIVALTMTLGTSVCAYGASSKDALELEATTAILIDAKTGEILFPKQRRSDGAGQYDQDNDGASCNRKSGYGYGCYHRR